MMYLLKIKLSNLIALIVILFLLYCFYYIFLIFTTGEWSRKNITIWNEMHIVSRFYHDKLSTSKNQLKEPIYLKDKIKYAGESYDLLAIPSSITNDPANPYVWIIANTHVDNDYALPYKIYITPGYAGDYGAFYLRCNYLQEFDSQKRLDPIVSLFLHQRCE